MKTRYQCTNNQGNRFKTDRFTVKKLTVQKKNRLYFGKLPFNTNYNLKNKKFLKELTGNFMEKNVGTIP